MFKPFYLIIECVKIGAFFERDLESFFNENFFKKSRIAIESNFEKDAFGGVPESHYGEKCIFFFKFHRKIGIIS